MQLVIEINEKRYESIMKHGSIPTVSDGVDAANAILNGIPLPKRHGRLIDTDELLKNRYEAIPVIHVINAPTIIEADKEGNT